MIITTFIQPKFEAKTQVLVNQETHNENLQAQQVQSNLQLVNTYSEIIKSPRIFRRSIKNWIINILRMK